MISSHFAGEDGVSSDAPARTRASIWYPLQVWVGDLESYINFLWVLHFSCMGSFWDESEIHRKVYDSMRVCKIVRHYSICNDHFCFTNNGEIMLCTA
jgi:hypothetical protein